MTGDQQGDSTSRASARSRWRRGRTATAVALLAALALALALPASGPARAASGTVLWGAWIGGRAGEGDAPWNWNAVTDFQQRAAGGKRLSLVHFSAPLRSDACGGGCPFLTSAFQTVRARGAIPFFSWASTDLTDRQVADGAADADIRRWAAAARRWGHPFFLRFAWEMNGSWFGWGRGANANTSAAYVAMWRHVHRVVTRAGVRNATWVWCPNIDPDRKFGSLRSLYPGNAYVDWTCLDGYNGGDPWRSFTDLFARSYDEIVKRIAPSKPMVIAETASTEVGGDKAAWIAQMFSALPSRFPRVRALLWFEKPEAGSSGAVDWPLSSSPGASAAFAAGVASPRYASNHFGSVSRDPIAPSR